MEKWEFGQLLSNGFSNETQQGFEELTPDAGIPFRRESFTDVYDIVRGGIILTRNDYLYFMDWYRNTVRQGTLPFTYYDCRVEKDRVARIVGKPTFSAISNRFSVSITISLEPTRFGVDSLLITESEDAYITTDSGDLVSIDLGVVV